MTIKTLIIPAALLVGALAGAGATWLTTREADAESLDVPAAVVRHAGPQYRTAECAPRDYPPDTYDCTAFRDADNPWEQPAEYVVRIRNGEVKIKSAWEEERNPPVQFR